MTTLSNLTIGADAPSGALIGTFDTDGLRFQPNGNPYGYFLISGKSLLAAWNGQAMSGQYTIQVHAPGGPSTSFTITLTAPVVAPGAVPTSITLTPASVTLPDNSTPGVNVCSVAVATSDGSPFAGAVTVSPTGLVAVSASKVNIARTLTATDDGAHTIAIIATQNGKSVSANLTLTIMKLPAPPPTVSPDGTTSTAPTGPALITTAGTWAWSSAAAGRPGEYNVTLNGSAVGIGLLMEVANGGQFYVNTANLGWYLWTSNGWTTSSGPVATPPPPPPPPPPPAAVSVITVTPAHPQIPDTTPKGGVVANYAITMSDGSPFAGTVGFGAPNFDGGGVFALVATSKATGQIVVSQNGPGVGPNAGTITDHITIVAT